MVWFLFELMSCSYRSGILIEFYQAAHWFIGEFCVDFKRARAKNTRNEFSMCRSWHFGRKKGQTWKQLTRQRLEWFVCSVILQHGNISDWWMREITELKCCARDNSSDIFQSSRFCSRHSTLECRWLLEKCITSHTRAHDWAKMLFNFIRLESTSFTRFGLFSSSFVRFFPIIYFPFPHTFIFLLNTHQTRTSMQEKKSKRWN